MSTTLVSQVQDVLRGSREIGRRLMAEIIDNLVAAVCLELSA